LPGSLARRLEAEGDAAGLTVGLRFGPERPRARFQIGFERLRVRAFDPGEEGPPGKARPPRPPLVVSGARGAIEGSDESVQVKADVSDPYWGQWKVSADLADDTGKVTLKLETRDAAVDQKKLEALPYVPRSVWEHVRASGRMTAKVSVGLFTDKPD